MLDMFEDQDDFCSCDSNLGSSPPSRPVIAECSDLFRAVMEDIGQEDNRLSRAVVDNVITKKEGNNDRVNGSDSDCDKSNMCKRCLSDRALCRCYQRHSKTGLQRVQWIDELLDKPLTMEKTITDLYEGRCSPLTQHRDNVKPILKHKANCIIIISE